MAETTNLVRVKINVLTGARYDMKRGPPMTLLTSFKILAVGIVTQMGAYFFLASGVPGLGSPPANAASAKLHAAPAATANITSLLPLPFSSLSFITIFSASDTSLEALTKTAPLRRPAVLVGSCLEMSVAEPPRNEAGTIIDAIVANS